MKPKKAKRLTMFLKTISDSQLYYMFEFLVDEMNRRKQKHKGVLTWNNYPNQL